MEDPAHAAAPHGPRAVALLGPQGSGKSTLSIALSAVAGNLRRAGRAPPATREIVPLHCDFLGERWVLLDCPGSLEFAQEAAAAVAVADLAVVVAEPDPERALALRPVFRMLEEQGVPFLVFVNKVDAMGAPAEALLAAMQAETSVPLVARQMPLREGERVSGYVDLLSERAFRYRPDAASERIGLPAAAEATEQAAHDALVDSLADRDDELLEQVIEGAAPSPASLYGHFRRDMEAGSLAGVMFGAAEHAHGVLRLWKALRHDAPEVTTTAARHGIAPDGPALAQVFRTSWRGAAGKLSFVRVWRGALRDGTSHSGVRIGGMMRFAAGELQRIAEAGAGDVVALGRLEGIGTGFALGEAAPHLGFPAAPPPLHEVAIAAADRRDDVKLAGGLEKLLEEDTALRLARDPESGETRLAGLGELHLGSAVERLEQLAGVAVRTARPRVAFRETIRRAVREHARLKRQTGGHGQFADVTLEIAPRARGEGFAFADRIVGGAVPKQYIAAVADAAEEAMRRGPFGHPVVDVAVTLVDGGFHAVDSSDMAFRAATRAGMAEALAKAEPVLLEPIHRIRVSAPNAFTAGVQRLLTGRRGQILGYAERPGWTGWDDTEALLPAAELHGLAVELRSQTVGLGSFVHEFDRLSEAPARLAEKVAQAASG
ncbi:MAG TPA: elongation factor G [Acidiphilium sp.]|uniref:elongation factor G n=1 Tax=unclassified Acidiphilium TaxID=2617493 RepID=UPI000BC761F5|nr:MULTISPECIES: elongation factor G [unclassified Acidiphilium]OYV55326.1 MAG: elongation factor G [Acidiphilium sp. 20-67-58]HQT61005.1 elongation factor G [Acidiphilium sp.]HQU12145.1 elongation factor G [Acidiphilium sp.]